jgi:hypothetical protein
VGTLETLAGPLQSPMVSTRDHGNYLEKNWGTQLPLGDLGDPIGDVRDPGGDLGDPCKAIWPPAESIGIA